jgi:hypothetical protein
MSSPEMFDTANFPIYKLTGQVDQEHYRTSNFQSQILRC